MEFLATTNFRDLHGHCRCYFSDRGIPCSFTPCFLYHQGRDCSEFVANGTCARGAECKLEHSQQRYNYGKRMPMRSDITAEVRRAWQDAQQFAAAVPAAPTAPSATTVPPAPSAAPSTVVDANVLLDSDEKRAVWEEIKKIDAKNNCEYLQKMSENIVKLMKLCPRNPLQTLERLFRKNDMNTWLIARKKPMFDVKELSTKQFGRPDALELSVQDVRDGSTLPYYFFLSSRQTHVAIAELLEESSSYPQNFEKLATCGTVILREKE